METLIKIILAFVIIAFVVVVISLILAFPVMLLWNWLMPVIFGLTKLTFWQAWGILVLCGFLFKSVSSSSS